MSDKMNVFEEIREQQQKTKAMDLKGKLSYFWYYYKIHFIVAVVVIVFFSVSIHQVLSNKPNAFYAIMLNSLPEEAFHEQMLDDFVAFSEINTDKSTCLLDTTSFLNYTTMSDLDLATSDRLIGLVQSKDLDVVAADESTFNHLAENGFFSNLELILTKEELDTYRECFYYVDNALLDQDYSEEELVTFDSADPTGQDAFDSAVNHHSPEGMKEPVVAGIYISDAPVIKAGNYYPGEESVLGITVTSQRTDLSRLYLNYLYGNE